MKISERYSYSKYRKKDDRPVGSGRVFVAPKMKYDFNPIINLPVKFWGNIFILVATALIFWFAMYSPYFRIKEVIVEGVNLVSSQEIIKSVPMNSNIFRFDIASTKAAIIETNPVIEDVAIYRGLPNAIKIVVLERKPAIVWQTQGKYFLVDDAGVVDKEIVATESTDFIHIIDQKNLITKVGDKVVSPGFIRFCKKINDEFFANTNIKISGYQVSETTFDLYVNTEAGFYVKFDTTRLAEKQLSDLKNIVISYRDSIKEYVDVRINGWAYYK